MSIHDLLINKNTIRVCGGKTFYKKLFYANSLADIAAMNAAGSCYLKYPAGTAAICAENSTIYVLTRDNNPYGEEVDGIAEYKPMPSVIIPTALPNPYALTFGNDTYDGSSPKEITPESIGLGKVFDLKGSVETVDDLPVSGNKVGDVWYVSAESVGYVWIMDSPSYRWEQLGLPIDLSGYLEKPVIVTETAPTAITLADNTEYYLTDVATLTFAYPTSDFESFISLSVAAGAATVDPFPAGTLYCGKKPEMKAGERWELSIKNGVVVSSKVGNGT